MASCRLLLLAACAILLLGTSVEGWGTPSPPPAPSESQCRPYIEKALKEMEQHQGTEEGNAVTVETEEQVQGNSEAAEDGESNEDVVTTAQGIDGTSEEQGGNDEEIEKSAEAEGGTEEETEVENDDTSESKEEEKNELLKGTEVETESKEVPSEDEAGASQEEEDDTAAGSEDDKAQAEGLTGTDSGEDEKEENQESSNEDGGSTEATEGEEPAEMTADEDGRNSKEEISEGEDSKEDDSVGEHSGEQGAEGGDSGEQETEGGDSGEQDAEGGVSGEQGAEGGDSGEQGAEGGDSGEQGAEGGDSGEQGAEGGDSGEQGTERRDSGEQGAEGVHSGEQGAEGGDSGEQGIEGGDSGEETKESDSNETSTGEGGPETKDSKEAESSEEPASAENRVQLKAEVESEEEGKLQSESEELPEEDLTMEIEIPENLRPRDHIAHILKLDEESAQVEEILEKAGDTTLKELKRLYDNAIKPLEMLYKYRDLSNRHFGDPEIFSKPLILFMGPWSGGKSTIINYLLDNEYKQFSLRTGAEPSPAYFNILMHGERSEILDGTQLAADWTFSGLQKFGQGLLDRLRGVKLNSPLLEKVNIVEIPGILEIRKQVERMFPFNDACQWFIDRADIIFLVYDPSKLDVGPETEAILDQLKGREYQTRIILNKADQVKPEELMRVQGTLIWNISPLMSSAEPPIMYSTSLWSMPYESGAPIRLLQAQEHAFLRDLREAIHKRVDNKIASARRFAVRVRNHAKMVDCYLTTYYNHKTFFGNKKKTADDIIEHPQDYHIYEGLSTLTNISRYDLPDPETYRDFFKLNPLYEFQQLAATCTYFRGCPINRLDIAIAYDLPELVGKYKKSVEDTLAQHQKNQPKS